MAERSSSYPEQGEGFNTLERISSKTSQPQGAWYEATNLMRVEAAAQRMYGKQSLGKEDEAVLGFSFVGQYIIIQLLTSVIALTQQEFFHIPELIINEDGDYLTTEGGDRLTT